MANFRSASIETGPAQAPIQNADAGSHTFIIKIGLRRGPEGHVLSSLYSPLAQTVPTVYLRGISISVQGPCTHLDKS